MIRIVVENILLFLLPTIAYVIYIWATRGDSKKGMLDEAPLAWLLVAGSLLVVVVLAFFGSDQQGGRPGQSYTPPSMKDGRIEPGQIK